MSNSYSGAEFPEKVSWVSELTFEESLVRREEKAACSATGALGPKPGTVEGNKCIGKANNGCEPELGGRDAAGEAGRRAQELSRARQHKFSKQ